MAYCTRNRAITNAYKNAINFKSSNTNLKVNDEIINIAKPSEIIVRKIKMTSMATKMPRQNIKKQKQKWSLLRAILC